MDSAVLGSLHAQCGAPVGAASIIFNATGWVTFADMLEVAPVGATNIILHGDRLGHVCRHVGGCDGWGGQHFQREFFGHGHIVVFVERPRHVFALLALREVLLCHIA